MRLLGVVLLTAYISLMPTLQRQLEQRAVVVKLGYTPVAEVLKVAVGDHRYTVAEWSVLKVLFYYGTTVDKFRNSVEIRPEYYNMFKTLETAVKLDPYNMDAYYFMQAAFTWDVGRARDVNAVLAYGMRYRTWDWYLPFFAGFNEAYFLNDFARAGEYMKKAAEISRNPLYTRLAARYFYESGRNDLGLLFLDTMIASTRDSQVREVYEMRRQALLAVRDLEAAIDTFSDDFGHVPTRLEELVTAGILLTIPEDPYGGEFYIDPLGKVRTTSKFAVLTVNGESIPRRLGDEGRYPHPSEGTNAQ